MPELRYSLIKIKLFGQKSKKLLFNGTRGLSKKFDKFISIRQGYDNIQAATQIRADKPHITKSTILIQDEFNDSLFHPSLGIKKFEADTSGTILDDDANFKRFCRRHTLDDIKYSINRGEILNISDNNNHNRSRRNGNEKVIVVRSVSPKSRRKTLKHHLSSEELKRTPIIPSVLLTYRRNTIITVSNESDC